MYEDHENNEEMNEQVSPVPESRESASAYSYVPEVSTPKKQKKGISAGGLIALALCFSLLGGCIGAGGVLLATKGSLIAPEEPQEAENVTVIQEGEREKPVVNTVSVNTDAQMSVSDVYYANVDSTVGITTSITTNYWGYQTTSAASGSGFIITEDGYILTNYHVIEDSSSVTVSTYDDGVYTADIVGYDIGNDIAVLKIDATGLTPVVLGSSDDLRVGETVVAIGNPLGELTFSLTQGVVSALDREVTFSSGSTMALIQTDAAINSGNSGGALFNLHGEVVGITNAKYSSSTSSSQASVDNIGFAIPIDQVRGIVESIIRYGKIIKPYIGVSVATVSTEMQSYGFPQGAAVKVVNEGSPAQAAGLQINDIITAVDGKSINSSSDLVNVIGRCTPDQVITLSVYRQNSEPLELTLTVGSQEQDAKAQPQGETQQPQQQQGGMYSFPFGGFGFGYGNAG